ncbi:Stk1 family PASTA domain-containing Ser/Thr kinase [Herbidospora sp. NEAU-GS84]|uniref:non-specific serine/threonine protein kinase n=1 Tax=Herbidospora solisilvae TaxID=2696284 RepID=A0A7C9NHL3_9ACTN|nr:Stk1 family PASTA domain-containing Ser/Thr kinase [Herbidospora solisilvae]NAS22752.1 Stk1 family PASTA domain-containing Ser/Thr kinase [Herbidospora solisilvae]
MDTTLSDPLVGHTLDGRYRVESRIARGGMASVYLALDVRLDRMVAIKVMHRSLAEDPQFVRRFIGEAKSVASLSHPNIVHVFDQGTDGDHVYLSMEYFPGKTLRAVLDERGPLAPREALEIMIPVLAALGSAHQAGLIHRDVKPENVLMTEDGRVKVVDFGLVRAIEGGNQTRSGVMIGTVGYMAPEQVTTGQADVRADVYAAGIMLFELLTGRQPFGGESPVSVAYRHVHESVPAPSSFSYDIPPALDALVAAATAKDPADRPRDANAMLVAAVEVHRTLPAATTGRHSAVRPAQAEQAFHSGSYATGSQTMIQPAIQIPPTTPPRPRRGFRVNWGIVVLALVMVGGIAFSGWYFTTPRTAIVPDLVQRNVEAARQLAESNGFTIKIAEGRYDAKVPKDMVLETSPVKGVEAERGSVITIIASRGPEMVTVPKVEGKTEADARVVISDAGLNVSRVRRTPSDTIARGLVIKTDPVVGKKVEKGSNVILAVSMGLLLPDVVNMPRDQAEALMRENGFDPSCINEVVDDTQQGTVIAQEPIAGAEVDKGARVCLTVSRGPDTGWKWPWEQDPSVAAPDFVAVPDVRFKDVNEAKRELEAAGFRVQIHKLFSRGRPGGDGAGKRVRGQNPLGQVPAGSTINLWY